MTMETVAGGEQPPAQLGTAQGCWESQKQGEVGTTLP